MKRLVAVGVLVALGVAGCSSSSSSYDGPRLRAIGSGDVGESHPSVPVGSTYTVMLRPVCTTGAPLHITSVEPRDATGGLRITSWAVRYLRGDEAQDGSEDQPPTVPADQVSGFDHGMVRARCGTDQTEEFSVSVSASKPKATMSGVLLHYSPDRSGSSGQTAAMQYAVNVCSTKDCPDALT